MVRKFVSFDDQRLRLDLGPLLYPLSNTTVPPDISCLFPGWFGPMRRRSKLLQPHCRQGHRWNRRRWTPGRFGLVGARRKSHAVLAR